MEVAKSFTEELLVPEDKRTFEVGGELFKWRYLFWEDFAGGVDRDQAEIADRAKKRAEQAKAEQNGEGDGELTFTELYADYQKRIEPYLDEENDAIKRWQALTKRKTNPVPAHIYQAVYMWLLEVTSGRPTEQPSPSGDGLGTTGTS